MPVPSYLASRRPAGQMVDDPRVTITCRTFRCYNTQNMHRSNARLMARHLGGWTCLECLKAMGVRVGFFVS